MEGDLVVELSGYEPRGRGFDSCQPHHINQRVRAQQALTRFDFRRLGSAIWQFLGNLAKASRHGSIVVKQQRTDKLGKWVSLGEVMGRVTGPERMAYLGELHDHIERAGIYFIDSFNRPVFCRRATKRCEHACRLVGNVADYELSGSSPLDEQHPVDECAGFPDDPFSLFGWNSEKVPVLHRGLQPSASDESAATVLNPAVLSLVVIAALLGKTGIDAGDRSATSKVVRQLDRLRVSVSDDTVRPILKAAAKFQQDPRAAAESSLPSSKPTTYLCVIAALLNLAGGQTDAMLAGVSASIGSLGYQVSVEQLLKCALEADAAVAARQT